MSIARSEPWNTRSFRRLLIDMHTPDWDERFLSKYDPRVARDACRDAGVTGVMVYFQSHLGLCYWPTKSGKQHAQFAGRDLLAETIPLFQEAAIPVCAYYSVNFNNWAYLEHPDWRLQPANKGAMGILPFARYGIVCLNNPAYRAFVAEQAREIVSQYAIDAFFFDMVWWMGVCRCPSCRRRCKAETGEDVPETTNWLDPVWCAFQAARERWVTELAHELRDVVQKIRPELQVYHNFALACSNWSRAISFRSAAAHDFLGGDFYGGREEQLVVSKLMLNLSERQPVEFMTTIAENLIEHERLQPLERLRAMGFAAVAAGSAFLLIAAVNPDGTLNRNMIERAKGVFERLAPYEPHFGGEAIEDVAVYYSSDSKMDFSENGKPIRDYAPSSAPNNPHGRSVQGACRALQRAHIPFGVITDKQLGTLSRYKVIVLPNIARMNPAEAEAFRNYVQKGGKLYASAYTSLTETSGKRSGDFMLADVFGCHFAHEETGRIVYLSPRTPALKKAIAPDMLVNHRSPGNAPLSAVRLGADAEGAALATLTLPYAYPHHGAVDDTHWAAIHSDPPWEVTDNPSVVSNRFGTGQCIYSAASIEGEESEAHEALFVALVRSLLGRRATFEVDCHPVVWASGFEQADRSRVVISLLNYQNEAPLIPLRGVEVLVRLGKGRKFTKAVRLPDMVELDASPDARGAVKISVGELADFSMIAVGYA
ncbi:MAG: beta-galactosidase trimerization domain-containing protein [Hyphomonadaceae bacterium]|nr:beta-galactosidase trimerization domain-containing protein [Hyphomonadaceae bacterium]